MTRLVVLTEAVTALADVALEPGELAAAINRGERPAGVALPAGDLRACLHEGVVIVSDRRAGAGGEGEGDGPGGEGELPGGEGELPGGEGELPGGEGGEAGAGRAAPRLSPRERQVLGLMAEGCSDQGVALRLGIRLATARTYAAAVREKLDARSRGEAVARALALGLLGGRGEEEKK